MPRKFPKNPAKKHRKPHKRAAFCANRLALGIVLTVLAQQIQRMLWQVRRLGDQSAADVGPMVFAVVICAISSEFIAKRQGLAQDIEHLDLQKVFQEDLDGFVKRQKRLARTGKFDV